MPIRNNMFMIEATVVLQSAGICRKATRFKNMLLLLLLEKATGDQDDLTLCQLSASFVLALHNGCE